MKKLESHNETQIDQFVKGLNTARKINALKTTSMNQMDLENKFIFDHFKWFQNSHPQQNLNHSQALKSYDRIRNQTSQSITSRIRYKRGHFPQRTLFQSLLSQLSQFQSTIPSLPNMDADALCVYRKKYIEKYLTVLLKEIETQCYQKSIFLKRVFTATQNILIEVFERLYKELIKEQKFFLENAVEIHKKYQNKIQELNECLKIKEQKIKIMEEHYGSICKKNKEKKKKNKKLTEGLVNAGQKIMEIQDQRNNLQKQYIKMLTIGFEGGLTYEEAHEQVLQQFFVSPSQLGFKHQLRRLTYSIKSQFTPQLPSKQKLSKILSPLNEINSQNKKLQMRNKKIQVNITGIKVETKGYGFGYSDKIKGGLIKNRESQTVGCGLSKVVLNEAQTQYSKSDFGQDESVLGKLQLNAFETEQKNKNSEKDKRQMREGKENIFQHHQNQQKNEQFGQFQDEIRLINSRKPHKKLVSNRGNHKKKNSAALSQFRRETNKFTQNSQSINKNANNRKKQPAKVSMVFQKNQLIPHFRQSDGMIRKDDRSSQSQFQSFDSSISQKSQQYEKTDLLSVIENMQKISPEGIFIDETLLFLLKKSIFSVKHSKDCLGSNRINKKNSKLLSNIRSSMGAFQKKPIHPVSMKNIYKLISIIYQNVFLKLSEKGFKPTKTTQINLLVMLKNSILKQYPLAPTNQAEINKKLAIIIKSMEVYSISNYLVKNFMMLSTLDDNIYSPIIYQNDIIFYFNLLKQLNMSNLPALLLRPQSSIRKSIMIGPANCFNLEQAFTTVGKLREVMQNFVKENYSKKELNDHILKKIEDIFQRADEIQIKQDTRLDIYKCSQLIIESVFTFKLEMIKSYTKLVSVPDITDRGLVTENLLIDLLGFLQLPKLKTLNIVNKFRYAFSKKTTTQGISLLAFVNFCMVNNLPDFDTILIFVRKYSTLPEGVLLEDMPKSPKFGSIQKIAEFSYNQERRSGMKMFIGADKMVHAKIVEAEASQLIQKIIGEKMTSLYIASLCLLEEKKSLPKVDYLDEQF